MRIPKPKLPKLPKYDPARGDHRFFLMIVGAVIVFLAATRFALGAPVPPIFDQGVWCSGVASGDTLDAEGLPIHTPSRGLAMVKKGEVTPLGCTAIDIGDMTTKSVCYELIDAANYRLKAIAFSETDCTGINSLESQDTAPVWLKGDPTGKPWLR